MTGKILRNTDMPGWSDVVPDASVGGGIVVEIVPSRDRIVVRYLKSGLSLPVDVPIPIPAFLSIAGALLSGMAAERAAPPPMPPKQP